MDARRYRNFNVQINDRAQSLITLASGNATDLDCWREIIQTVSNAAEIATGLSVNKIKDNFGTDSKTQEKVQSLLLELVKKESTSTINLQCSSNRISDLLQYMFLQLKQDKEPSSRNSDSQPHGHLYKEQWMSLAAQFLGPKAENIELFNELAIEAFQGNADFRNDYFPDDARYVTSDLKSSDVYKEAVKRLKTELKKMIKRLQNSVPNASIRYQAHMCWDTTMPANLGYLAALLYNSNNVANEASPVTTSIEIEVGDQLCRMLGYGHQAWGHITADGSIANIEAMWTCRNLKFYPLAVRKALNDTSVRTLDKARKYKVFVPRLGEKRILADISAWDAQNLLIDDIVRMPVDVSNMAGVDHEVYSEIVDEYSLANLGIFGFMKVHGLENAPVVLGPKSTHYSWPKAATMLGLGQSSLIGIEYDKHARMDMNDLREQLMICLEREIPVISVVVVMGTTEESAVDPLYDVLQIRKELQSMEQKNGGFTGMTFAINADAAWGGYFMTMITESLDGTDAGQKCEEKAGCIPISTMSDYTEKQLRSMKDADTITTDPHKSGFCPYPAGGLCYRHKDMKRFIKIEADVVYHMGVDPAVGVWGVEGSKPGASPAGVFLSHQVIGLDRLGYGRILGQCTFGAKLFYCMWLTIAKEEDDFICVPMKPLPDNRNLEETKIFIREHILDKTLCELEKDDKVMSFVREVGPDMVINAFAVNRKGNTDVEVCNNINIDIFKRLSHTNESKKDIRRVPLMLTQGNLPAKLRGEAAEDFKRRLGIIDPKGNNLKFLINTVMNPWVAASNQIEKLGAAFRQTVIDVIGKHAGDTNHQTFVLVGIINERDESFAEYMTELNVIGRQYVATVYLRFLDKTDANIIRRKQEQQHNPTFLERPPIILVTKQEYYLEDLIFGAKTSDITVQCFARCFPSFHYKPLLETNIRILDVFRCHRIDTTVERRPNQISYFMYGQGDRVFLSRNITVKPDFHQVIALSARPHNISEDLLEVGVNVKVNIPTYHLSQLDTYVMEHQAEKHFTEMKALLREAQHDIIIAEGLSVRTKLNMNDEDAFVWYDMTNVNGLSRKCDSCIIQSNIC